MKIEGVVLLWNTVHLLAVRAPFACILDVIKHAGPPKQAASELKSPRSAVVTCQVMYLVQHKWNQFGGNHQRIKHLVPCLDLTTQALILVQVKEWDHSRWGLI